MNQFNLATFIIFNTSLIAFASQEPQAKKEHMPLISAQECDIIHKPIAYTFNEVTQLLVQAKKSFKENDTPIARCLKQYELAHARLLNMRCDLQASRASDTECNENLEEIAQLFKKRREDLAFLAATTDPGWKGAYNHLLLKDIVSQLQKSELLARNVELQKQNRQLQDQLLAYKQHIACKNKK